MLPKTLICAICILLLASCDRETFHDDSQILNCRVTDRQIYGWLAEEVAGNGIANGPGSETETFSIDVQTGNLETGLEHVCCDRAVRMSVRAKGRRGADFWAMYETVHYGYVPYVSTHSLIIEVAGTAEEMPFVMSGGNLLSIGVCVQGLAKENN